MQKNAYLFIGQSGAGKGTQAALLEETLTTTGETVLHIETGNAFRDMLGGGSYTALHTKELMETGILPPAFIAVNIWSQSLISGYTGSQTVIFDGTPRVASEVPLILSAVSFYEWNLHVIYIDVSDEWAYEKTKARGRIDDVDDARLWGRIEWFHHSVMPAIEALKDADSVSFHTIHGEQTIEQVHNDIVHALTK